MKSNFSKGGLSEVERGLREVKLSTLEKICNTLDIKLSDFFKLLNAGKITNYLTKLVQTFSSDWGGVMPEFLPASIHFKIQAIFLPRILIIWQPSSSFKTSSAFEP